MGERLEFLHVYVYVCICKLNKDHKSNLDVISKYSFLNKHTKQKYLVISMQTCVTRWTKHTFPCSKLLSPGGLLWANTSSRVSQFHRIGVNFTARLTYLLFVHITTLKSIIKSFLMRFHNWPVEKMGI